MAIVGPSGRRRRGSAVAALVFTLFACAVPLHAQPAPREANVRLEWRSGWTATGITVARGETLTIRVRTVRAPVNDSRQEPSTNPATGRIQNVPPRQQRDGDSLADTLFKAAARQIILGRVGEGAPFVVGRRYRRAMTAGGPLSLRWNVPREMAGGAAGFDIAIRVEPAAAAEAEPEERPDPPRPADPPKLPAPRDPIVAEPQRKPIEPAPAGPAERPSPENESVAEPAADQDNSSLPEQNLAAPAGPEVPAPPAEEPADPPAAKAASAGPVESGPTAVRPALIGGGIAALLLILAAAGIAIQRLNRRRLVNRTRSLLALSPSLDLGEGACRGGSLPADGPAASLRARLEEGAVRCKGGEDE
jgi:hypothetical protein